MILLPVILSGAACSRSVNLKGLSDGLAPVIGVEADSFQFLSYCGFTGQLRSGVNEQRVRLVPGIVAVTNDGLLLVEGVKPANMRNETVTSIPLDEINGVSRREGQLILLHGGEKRLIVVAEGRARPNAEKALDLFGMLLLKGVPENKSEGLIATNWDLYWNMFVEGPKFRLGLPQNGGAENVRY